MRFSSIVRTLQSAPHHASSKVSSGCIGGKGGVCRSLVTLFFCFSMFLLPVQLSYMCGTALRVILRPAEPNSGAQGAKSRAAAGGAHGRDPFTH